MAAAMRGRARAAVDRYDLVTWITWKQSAGQIGRVMLKVNGIGDGRKPRRLKRYSPPETVPI
jgi:hypothetical protein